jgi:hypothetical protein
MEGLVTPLLLVFFSIPALAETLPDQQTLLQQWALAFSEEDRQPSRQAGNLPTDLFHTTFTTTVFALPTLSSRLRDMTSDIDRPRTQGIQAATRWLKDTFTTEAEVAHNAGWETGLLAKPSGDTRDDFSKRMVRFALTAESGAFRYGMTSRTAGKAFLNAPDQASREVWGEWNLGSTKFRSAIGQFWNNVEGDPTRSRLEQRYGRVGLSWTKPSWPELSFTYTHSSLASALDPAGIAPQRTQNNAIEGALGYSSLSWTARVTSAYIITSDRLRGGAESTALLQTFTAVFRPVNTLTITPTMSYREEMQQWTGVRVEAPTAALVLNYKHSHRLFLSAMGNYTSTRSSDGLIDIENVSGKGVLAWELRRALTWSALLAFETGYSRLSNRVTPTNDIEDISGQVRLVLASL